MAKRAKLGQARLDQALLEQIEASGFRQTQIGPNLEGFSKLATSRPDILGICRPIDTHLQFIATCDWQEGPVLLVREESPKLVLWEQFFCLETLDFPRSALSLRDYFDYRLEADARNIRPDVHALFGPGWRYLFPCADFMNNLKSSIVNLSTPIIGNALNIRSDSVSDLLAAHAEIKNYMASKLPVPHLWAYPSDLPVAAKDNFLDLNTRRWYFAVLEGEFAQGTSLVDLHPDESGICRMMQHDFQGNIKAVEMKINEILVRFSSAQDKFKSRRKLSRLKISYLW